MRIYVGISLFLVVLQLFLLALVEILAIPILINPFRDMTDASLWVAIIGVGLLIFDVVLPIPSSLVMVGHGAFFGIFIGTCLSLIGATAAAMIGFIIGRLSLPILDKFIESDDQQNADNLLRRMGWMAIILTRPIPILAETTVVLAGTSSMKWTTVLFASLCGNIPIALLYAITGATAANLNNFLFSFVIIIVITGSLWGINHLFLQQARTGAIDSE